MPYPDTMRALHKPIKLNPHDFEYLTISDQEYLASIANVYLQDSGQLKNFHTLGAWHQVDSQCLREIVERVAAPSPRPCSRGHVKGLWCMQDPDYIAGPKILKYQSSVSSGSGSTTPRTPRTPRPPGKIRSPRTPKNKYSIPRKYQIVPKPTPWIIMDPSKKRNFISDDPPDPSYRELTVSPRSAHSRKSTPRSKASSDSDRYVASTYAVSVSPQELNGIVGRVCKPTVASRGGVDLREKYRNKDYVYGSRDCTPNMHHISSPTISSNGGIDIAEKFDNKDYVYGSRTVTPEVLTDIVSRITRPTVASTGGEGHERDYTDFVYGGQSVSKAEMEEIINRMTQPTISSTGAEELKNKKYQYIRPKDVKTNIQIPGLETKFMGRKKVTQHRMQEMVERLSRLTPAYKAKYSTNPHVWKDDAARTGPAHKRQAVTAL